MTLNTSISFLGILCVFAASSVQDVCGPDKESCCSTDHNGGKTNITYLHTCGNKTYNIFEGLCCNGKLICGLSRLVVDCCESDPFNPLNEKCCNGTILNLTNIKDSNCVSDGKEKKSSELSKNNCTITPVLQCGSDPYNPLTHMCCSGRRYQLSAHNKCCGAKAYNISQKVLCCNGILYENLPENSQCVEGYIYMENQTIMTCGTNVSIITQGNRKADCCGKLPVGKNQTCCSSSIHNMRYEIKPAHYCCGHQYYKKALWGCCAGDLTPTPNKDSPGGNRLKMLTDLIPIMCNETVVFGKVESVALQNLVNRTIWLRVVREVSLHHCKSLHLVTLDHCSSPALEIGKTYLWKKNGTQFKPISLPIGHAFDIHVFFTVCNKVNETICDV